MARFAKRAAALSGYKFKSYAHLHAWSVEHFADFWALWLRESGALYAGSSSIVFRPGPGNDWTRAEWFPNLKLNFAQNLIERMGDLPLVGCDEQGRRREFLRAEVLERVRGLQRFLRLEGVGPGDVVAGLLPNLPETIIAMLATTSLGATWSSCSPDFGVQGILDRFTQINPKVLFVADGYTYAGKRIPLAEKNRAVLEKLPSLNATVTIPFLGIEGNFDEVSLGDRGAIEYTVVPFNSPLYVLFSSGTTGQPKCIVHGVGRVLLQLLKELKLHGDLDHRDKLLYFTTCGWMMWNWMNAGLATGATVYCYDGSPSHPGLDSLWGLVDREHITAFGTSAKFIASCRSAGVELKKLSFSALRTVFSTGSPLMPEDFDYFYAQVRPRKPVQLASISGGTDIVSCFMLGTPLKPVLRGEIQAAGLGMDVRAYNEAGHSVIGQKGELVCAAPFMSMPIRFMNDEGHRKYRKAYFERFPGVWHHGDFVTVTEEGGVIVHGRSDATLNPGGVRLGTAEIYRQVETHPAVQDSIAVGQQWQGDERVVLFVKLKDPAQSLDATLVKEIKDRIRAGASPRHVPAVMLKVADIPYTVSGKKVELAVKALVHGETPSNIEALANPQSLAQYKNIPELK